MNHDEILTAMGQANHDGQWSLLCDRLRALDSIEVFRALFPIAANDQSHGPAYDAACLLFAVKPTCLISCKDAIKAMLSCWDISIEEVPWYLAGHFGEEIVLKTIEELDEEMLNRTEWVRLNSVRYWAEIFFTLSSEEIREYERRQEVERGLRPSWDGTAGL